MLRFSIFQRDNFRLPYLDFFEETFQLFRFDISVDIRNRMLAYLGFLISLRNLLVFPLFGTDQLVER